MSHLDPIAYTYEADWHCPACAEERFGRTDDGFIAGVNYDGTSPEDDEGNPIGVVAPWDEVPWDLSEDGRQVLVCGTCFDEITELEADDDDSEEE